MSQNNRYMAVSVTETKADTKKAKSAGQSRGTGVQDASVAALERELAIYKRDSGIEMEELRTKVNNMPKGGGAGEPGKDGVGIESVEQTVTSTESGGENKVEITLTDGQKTEVVIRNGKDGKDGGGGGGGGNVTPESIGAVKKSGDTMTGQLSLPSLRVTNYGTPLEMGKYLDMHNPNSPDDDFSVRLIADGDTLKMQRKGVGAYDTFYHTGNKPTAADVGARPNTWLPTPGDIGAMKAHGVINDGSNFDTLADGVYNYNGWATYSDSSVPKPFGNAFGMWIKQSRWGSADNSYRVDIAINCETGDTYAMYNYDGVWHKNKATLTAADVGALSTVGGTLTGQLGVASNGSPTPVVITNSSGGTGYVGTVAGGKYKYIAWLSSQDNTDNLYIISNLTGTYRERKIATTDYIDEQILKGEW